ncbi:MAG: AraC family transcriptional regulator [Gemmatimonadaceae bacterium]
MDAFDPLADVLEMVRVRGAVMAHVRARAPWGLRIGQAPRATFHAVAAGACWVRLTGRAPRELLPGDVVLLPTGAPHTIASTATGPTIPWDRIAKANARDAAGEVVLDGPGGSTHIICAAYDYDREVAHPLLSLLPSALFVSAQPESESSAVQTTLRLLRQELTARRSGSATIIERLIDVLFVHVMRAWMDDNTHDTASWLKALRDPIVSRALTALHSAPNAPWTIEKLASEVSMSRATLTRRFVALVGEPPLAYLTRWRMDLAARQLRDTDHALGAIAHDVGYTSEFAFSRAFSRLRGSPPGRYRVEARRRANAGA